MRALVRMCRGVTAALAITVAAALPAPGETFSIPVLERGEELERLEFLIGRWSGRLTRYLPNGETLEVSPSLENLWSLGDAWLESRDLTELPDGTVIHNLTWLTWGAREGGYVGAWHDNVMPGFVTFKGRWLEGEKLELDTGEIQLFGRSHRVVFTYGKVSDDEFTVEMLQAWDGDEPRKVAEGHFTRAGAAGAAAARDPATGDVETATAAICTAGGS